jgi:hypothetical protein
MPGRLPSGGRRTSISWSRDGDRHGRRQRDQAADLFWAVAIVALIWEMFGVGSYLYHVTLSDEALQALPEGQRRHS